MGVALKDRPMHLQPEPDGLLRLRIDPVTGRAATAGASGAFFELFNKDAPPQPAQEVSSSFQDNFGSEPAPVPIDLF
ncbi:hypothetical protein D3C81_1852260 [compost metagenome]